ncbi:WD40 repeat domain-containing serine/threonine-protein kinase [Lacipirellula limnantheis]|uniref:Serine/threonine-protein kinase PrkC n=1 Tax=Lacipirellula limnantheis TaxID=2528024 RepID=A0A517TTN3_9BACT|nr:protein kinase [Lacipirellula limnantheis]QDT71738.1 Serine/threonine-protein kinase PrkC [Lacipirellula limnantheis]
MTGNRDTAAADDATSLAVDAELTPPASDDDTSPLVERLLVETEEAISRGEPWPSLDDDPLSPDEAADLREMQGCLLLLDQARRSGWLQEVASESQPFGWPEPADLGGGQRIGRFEIIRELGRGGHGVVFLARDPSLRRLVALKVARPENLVSDDLRRRFQREAEAAGALRHPNVIEVYEVGEAGPISYIASAYCAGPTLQQWLADSGLQASDREAAATVVAIAQGVAHAHAAGVLHRDIKPSNVLLDSPQTTDYRNQQAALRPNLPLGTYTPMLGDFGLAKMLDGRDDQTRTGATLGTPAYMSPEQASGRLDRIGPPTDVYGLGVLLYELLVGRPPHRGENDVDTARRVCEEAPIGPHRFRPSLDRDLEAICLRCLEKEPAARYASAQDLIDDLSRYLEGKPTLVRPLGRARTALRWIKRRPLPAALMAVSLALFVVLAGGGWWTSLRNEQALRRESALRSQAEAKESEAAASSAEARRLLYASDLRAAQQMCESGQLKAARELLRTHAPHPGQTDLREFAWHYLWRLTTPAILTFRGHQSGVRFASLSANGKLLVTVSHDGAAKLWNADSQQTLQSFDDFRVRVAAFSPDGSCLAVAADDGMISVYDTTNLRELHRFHGAADDLTTLAFSQYYLSAVHEEAAEARLAGGHESGAVSVWSADTGNLIRVISTGDTPVTGITFTEDCETLLTAADEVERWNVATGERLEVWSEEGATVTAFAKSVDNERGAACYSNGRIVIRSLRQPDVPPIEMQYPEPIRSAAFDPNGRRLATTGADGCVRIWDVEARRCIKEFRGHVDRVSSLQFSVDGSRLVTSSDDQSVKITDVTDPYVAVMDDWPEFTTNCLGFSADGNAFGWAGHPGNRNYPVNSGQVSLDSLTHTDIVGPPGPIHFGVLYDFRFVSPGYGFVAVNRSSELISIEYREEKMDWRTDTVSLPIQKRGDLFPAMAAKSDGSLVVAGARYPLCVRDLTSDADAGWIGSDRVAEVTSLTIDAADQKLLVASKDQRVSVWNLSDRQCVLQWPAPANTRGVALRGADEFVWIGEDDVIRIVDLKGRQRMAIPSHAREMLSLALAPNRRTLAVGHRSGEIAIWDLSAGRQLVVLTGHDHPVTKLCFSQNGEWLGSGSSNGEILLWSAPDSTGTWREQEGETSNSGFTAIKTDALSTEVGPQIIPALVPPGLEIVPERFRRVFNYARDRGHYGAFPTYVDREMDDGVELGIVLLKKDAVHNRSMLQSEFNAAIPLHRSEKFLRHQQIVATWGREKLQKLAFGNFHMAREQNEVVFGVVAINADAYEKCQMTASADAMETLERRLRTINQEAVRRGYCGGLPTFDDDPASDSYGAAFFQNGAAESRSVSASSLTR